MEVFELNNIRKDNDIVNTKLKRNSPVVEIFAAMVNGESLDRFGDKADKAVKYIEGLAQRAQNGDGAAASEINTIRRFIIELPLLDEAKLLSVFGEYEPIGFDDNVEREVYKEVGELAREQSANGDVVFPHLSKEVYPVPTFIVSGGYEIDYRRMALGDMTQENRGMANVRTQIMNMAKQKIVKKVYEAIKAASGVKYVYEFAGLTKQGVDGVLTKIRRFGRPSVIGDYAVLSQFSAWAGYVGQIGSTTITGISDAIINQLNEHGLLGTYNGAVLAEMANPYNILKVKPDGSDFETLLPAGLAFVVPTGVQSPIKTWTRGGLTSMTGNDVKTGKLLTRFDLEVACDVAKTQEYKIGCIYDTDVGGLV